MGSFRLGGAGPPFAPGPSKDPDPLFRGDSFVGMSSPYHPPTSSPQCSEYGADVNASFRSQASVSGSVTDVSTPFGLKEKISKVPKSQMSMCRKVFESCRKGSDCPTVEPRLKFKSLVFSNHSLLVIIHTTSFHLSSQCTNESRIQSVVDRSHQDWFCSNSSLNTKDIVTAHNSLGSNPFYFAPPPRNYKKSQLFEFF